MKLLPRPIAVPVVLAFVLSAGVAGAQTTAPDNPVTLNPFVVQDKTDEGYLASSATAASRIAQKLEDIPQQISIINSALIDTIKPTSFQDILQYDSGVNFNNSQFNGSSPLIRGFATPIPLRNGTEMGLNGPSQFGSFLGLEAIEQVEIVKGAAAVLYGPSQPGGVINYVTKAPQYTQSGSLEGTLFSEGGGLGTLDVTGPAGIKASDGRQVLAYRLVVTDEGRELYQMNNQSLQRQMIYSALNFQPFRDLTIDANYEYDHQKVGFFNSLVLPQATVNGLAAGTLTPSQVSFPKYLYPVNWTYADTGTYLDEHDAYAQISAVLHHDFGKFGNWNLRVHYTWSKTSLFRQIEDIPTGDLPQAVTAANIGQVVNLNQTVTAADVAAGRLWVAGRYLRQIDTPPIMALDTQWDLTGTFATGPIKHTLLFGSSQNLGVDYQSGITGTDQVERDAYTGAAGSIYAIWVDHPNLSAISNIDWNGPAVTTITKTATGVPYNDSIRVGVPWFTVPKGGNYDKDLYLFDAASLLDDKLQVSGGIRLDEVGQTVGGAEFTNRQWTFRYGGVYKVLPWLQFYLLHSGSFLPNSAAASAAFGYFVAPQKGSQNEAGVRFPLFDKKLEIDASVYQIKTTNIVQNNPFGNVGLAVAIPANNFVFVPGETNNGVDLSAKVNISANTQVIASYSHYDMWNQGGPAQVAVGLSRFAVNNVPNNQLSIWGRYTPDFPALRHLSVDAGYRYVGHRSAGGVGSPPAYWLAGYGVADLGLGYDLGRWRIQGMVHNLFNIYAIDNATATTRVFPVEPREATISAKVKF